MGRVLSLGLDVIGTGRSVRLDEEFANDINNLMIDAGNYGNPREKKHAKAIKLFAYGRMHEACGEWENILKEHPTDLLALKFAHDAYFYLGEKESIRDGVARVLPNYKPSTPCASYLHGMHAFGLEECEQYEQAEKEARLGLNLEPKDAWATHAVAHCMEMTGRHREGIDFMEGSETDWSMCSMLACHNYWHTGLFYIEKGDREGALSYYDREIGKRSRSGLMLDMVDASSYLLRLELEGIPTGSRWNDLQSVVEPHIKDHILTFNDAHIRMVTEWAENTAMTAAHRKSIENFVRNGTGDNCVLMKTYGETICNALSSYHAKNYSEVVKKLAPIRENIYKIGGSNAQRDLFCQILIHSCLQSENKEDKLLSKTLIDERAKKKKASLINDRFLSKFKDLSLADVWKS